jgi:hypothetical protein
LLVESRMQTGRQPTNFPLNLSSFSHVSLSFSLSLSTDQATHERRGRDLRDGAAP